jgi:hypothetical protein
MIVNGTGSTTAANSQALDIANGVNTLYLRLSSYKIIVSVVATQAWTAYPTGITTVTSATAITDYLDEFTAW